MTKPSFPPRELARCQAMWQLADASRHLLRVGGEPLEQQLALKELHSDHTRQALLESGRLAYRVFGVTLGQHVVFLGLGASWPLTVDYLRPTELDGVTCIATSGLLQDGERALFFLGRDELAPRAPGQAEVRDLSVLRRLRA